MKRKNKKIWAVVIISVQLLLLFSAITGNANAWKNGATPSGKVTEAQILSWRAGGHYGTHDGIAEAALDAVKLDQQAQPWKVANDEGQPGTDLPFWDARRTVIFLIATEAPDMGKKQVSMTLNGKPVFGRKTSRRHNTWFHPVGAANSMRVRVNQMTNTLEGYVTDAELALQNGHCDLAAWYMGCVSHLIADLSNWGHTIHWEDVKKNWDPQYGYNMHDWQPPFINSKYNYYLTRMVTLVHTQVEEDVLKYTNARKPQLFDYPTGFRVSPAGIKHPREIALELAFNARFDKVATAAQINNGEVLTEGAFNALWMFHSSYTVNTMTDTHVYQKIESQTTLYTERVDELLDYGVKAVAAMIDYFGQKWNASPRICKGAKVDQKMEKVAIAREQMIGISMFIMMGIAMSFFSSIMMLQIKAAMKTKKEDNWLFPLGVPA